MGWTSNALFLSLVLVLFASCKSDEETVTTSLNDDDYAEFKSFNLSQYDLEATLMLPDETANIGASTFPEVYHEYDGFKWEIAVGPNFHMVIEDWGDNKSMVQVEKKRLKELSVFKINYLIDEPNLIVYERTLIVEGSAKAPKTVGLEHQSYHVYGQHVIDNYNYVFKSADEGAERKIIELMARSIRSVKVNKAS